VAGPGRGGGGGGVGRQGGRWEREMGNGRGGVEEGECVGRAGGEGVGWGGVKWEMGNGRCEMGNGKWERCVEVISEDQRFFRGGMVVRDFPRGSKYYV